MSKEEDCQNSIFNFGAGGADFADFLETGHVPPLITPDGVEITNWADMPLGIEASLAPAFCVYGDLDELIGKTFICKVTDEETNAITYEELFLSTAPGAVPVPWADQGEKRECGACPEGDGQQGFQGA